MRVRQARTRRTPDRTARPQHSAVSESDGFHTGVGTQGHSSGQQTESYLRRIPLPDEPTAAGREGYHGFEQKASIGPAAASSQRPIMFLMFGRPKRSKAGKTSVSATCSSCRPKGLSLGLGLGLAAVDFHRQRPFGGGLRGRIRRELVQVTVH